MSIGKRNSEIGEHGNMDGIIFRGAYKDYMYYAANKSLLDLLQVDLFTGKFYLGKIAGGASLKSNIVVE